MEGYTSKWQERDEQNNFSQRHDVELVKEELRPVVFQEIRDQVDAEVSVMLQNFKAWHPKTRTVNIAVSGNARI